MTKIVHLVKIEKMTKLVHSVKIEENDKNGSFSQNSKKLQKMVHLVKIAKNDKNGSFIIYISYICAGIARGKKLSKAEQPNSP